MRLAQIQSKIIKFSIKNFINNAHLFSVSFINIWTNPSAKFLATLHVLHAWGNCLVGYSKTHGACNMNCAYCMAGYSAIKVSTI